MDILKKILIPEVYLPLIYILIGYVLFIIIRKVLMTIFKKQKKITGVGRNSKRYNTVFQVILDIIKIIIVTLVILSQARQ